MDIAIIGLPQSGKSTVFNALTGGRFTTTGGGAAVNVGVVKVDDSRLAKLAEMYSPRKMVPAEIKFWDVPAVAGESSNQFLVGRQRTFFRQPTPCSWWFGPSTTRRRPIPWGPSTRTATCRRCWPS